MSDMQPAATQRKPANKPKAYKPSPSRPLPEPRRELFAQKVAMGVPVKEAYREAGYKGENRASLHQVRWNPDVAGRIEWLLNNRVEASARARHKKENVEQDIRVRAVKRLESLALGDIRSVVQWTKRAQVDKEGNVTGFADAIDITPSHLLTAEQAALVKGVFFKGGEVRLETTSQLDAIEKLCKALGIYQDAAPLPPAQVVNVSVGANALEIARRVAFLLSAAQNHAPAPEPLTIEGKVEPSE